MDERTGALTQIAALARQHGISADEIVAVLGQPPVDGPATPGRSVLVRVLGVLGGIFVFAGIGVFIALQWDGMNSAARVVVTLGSGLAAFALAVLSHREARYGAATTPLLLTGAVLEPTGMLVAFDEFGTGGDWRLASLVATGTMALQFAAAFHGMRRSTPLFLVILFGALFWWTTLDLLDVDDTLVALVLGGSVLLAAVATDRAGHGDITPPWYLVGAGAFLYGAFDAVERTPLEIGFLAVAAGFVYLSAVLHSRTLLAVSTLAILAYTGWFTSEHFAESIGWPLALIVFGIAMMGLSALAVRIDRDYVRERTSRSAGE